MTTSLKELLLVLAGVVAALFVVEAGVQRVAPIPPPILEVDDGVADYAAGDPDTLVLGSSHTRSFAPMRDLVAAQTHGANRMALVPVEWGTFGSYRWVLDHRIKPLAETRHRLSRAILVSTFYDLCMRAGTSESNLPARAWTARDFFSDVGARGLDDFNGNYLQTRLARLLPFSALVHDRGHGRVVLALLDRAHGVTDEERAARRRDDVIAARANMERQYEYCDDAGHKRALREMIGWFRGRGVEVTLVLFPLLPDIVSERSRETTLARYDRYVAGLARELPIRVTDMTRTSPMVYADFQPDLDHLTRAGNVKFSRWALGSPMRWLLDPLAPPAGAAP
jgi:hypothetical protein